MVAVVALQAVAQTTAMALLSGEESGSSRALSAEKSLDTRNARNIPEEEKTFIEEKMIGSRCHMGKDGKECIVKREAERPFSTMLNKAQISARVKLVNEKLSLATIRQKREIEDFSEKESLAMARINSFIEGGGHQPPTEKSRIARDTGESVMSSIVTREDESSALSKSLLGLESAKMSEECSEDQPSGEARGLLSGLLGGENGGNCTAQGNSVST